MLLPARWLLGFLALPIFALSSYAAEPSEFPDELVRFKPYSENPVFAHGKPNAWDALIRERGWILKDGDLYHLWYTGYDGSREGLKMLGHATSSDGIHWKRNPKNPIYRKHWVEDMMVVKHQGTFFLFAEGKGDQAHLLKSSDGVNWKRVGVLDVRTTNGKPIEPGPYGTPTAYFENGTWHLFYERRDAGVWLATSKDMQVWTNVQDEPVLTLGPAEHDRLMIALNQIIKYKGRYYAFYHGSGSPEKPRLWSPAIATSTDLIHWTKYPKNPLRDPKENRSSGIVIPNGNQFRFYTMHGQVDLFLPTNDTK